MNCHWLLLNASLTNAQDSPRESVSKSLFSWHLESQPHQLSQHQKPPLKVPNYQCSLVPGFQISVHGLAEMESKVQEGS